MTSQHRFDTASRYAVGFLIMAACIFGGSSRQELVSEVSLKLLACIVAGFVLTNSHRDVVPRTIWMFSLAGSLLFVWQLIPFPASLLNALQPVTAPILPLLESKTWRPISLSIGPTLETMSFFVSLALITCAIASLRWDNIERLIPLVLIGSAINMTVGISQFAFTSADISQQWAGHVVRAGLFANPNHFSSMLYAMIPLAFVYFMRRGQFVVLFAYLFFCFIALFAAGSRAGIALGLCLLGMSTFAAFGLVWMKGARVPGKVIMICFTIGVLTIPVAIQISSSLITDELRLEIWAQTLEAIRGNGIPGTGFGSFPVVFQSYERFESIHHDYVNRAHNDYLEIVLEGGIFAAIFLVGALVALAVRLASKRGEPLASFAALSLFGILVHSLVDYPLRTYAISLLCGLLVAIVVKAKPHTLARDAV